MRWMGSLTILCNALIVLSHFAATSPCGTQEVEHWMQCGDVGRRKELLRRLVQHPMATSVMGLAPEAVPGALLDTQRQALELLREQVSGTRRRHE